MKIQTILFILLAAAMGGCFPQSIYPLYTDETRIADDRLLGRWTVAYEGGEEPIIGLIWTFEKASDDPNSPPAYTLDVVGEEGQSGRFDAHLTQLGGRTYLDIFPKGEMLEDMLPFYTLHLIPAHTFMNVYLGPDTLFLRPIDIDKLQQIAKNHPDAIDLLARDSESMPVITSPTHKLRDFMTAHGDPERDSVFADPSIQLTRYRALLEPGKADFDERLIGTWQSDEGDGPMKITARDGGSYEITTSDDDDERFYAYLVKVRDKSFVFVFKSASLLDHERKTGLSGRTGDIALLDIAEKKFVARQVEYVAFRDFVDGGELVTSDDTDTFQKVE